MKVSIGIVLTAAWLSFEVLPTDAQANDKPVSLTNEWRGSVADPTLAEGAPACITSTKQLKKLWEHWKLPDKVPDVDFTKEIVVFATTRGSHIGLSCALSDAGDLKILARCTVDFGDGFRYIIATVSREGVTTVDGKELPKD